MNILILGCGSRSDILTLFRRVAGPGGRVIAADADPWASVLYEADKWHLLPSPSDAGYIEHVLRICRADRASCVIPLAAEAAEVLAESRERFTREGIAVITSGDALKTAFRDDALCEAYRGCFARPKRTLAAYVHRTYKACTRRLPLEFKKQVMRLPDYLTVFQENKRLIRREQRRIVYLLGVPAHGNLGDHAIAHAQLRFIQKRLPDARIIEITDELTDMHLRFIRRHIRPEDLFCMIGGGNFGDEYLWYEQSRRRVCAMFPENRVIIFPQTISYSDTPRGRRELELTQATLGRHPGLTITARDRISHRRAQEWFPNAKCILTPDIVLSLEPVMVDVPRKGILCCLRRDVERNADISAGDIVTRLADGGFRFTLTDTVVFRSIPIAERTEELQAKWQEFCGAELVITDRLHGMIFSCITSTPCVVIDNYNHKIRNFYQTWLSDIPTIRFAESAEDILPLAQALLAQDSTPWDPDRLAQAYAPLLDALRKEI